jgi:fatty-acyl-CoA synthase
MPETLALQATQVMGPCLEQTYGATETHGGFTLLPPSDHLDGRKLRSCGKPMSYLQVRVVDQSGDECAPGEVGEIVVQGSCLMRGYWDAPEATREAMKGGWYHTSDMGYFDEDGYLYVHDRKHDMIITGAENVYPAEVENALIAHPQVAEAAVFGVPDEDWGEAVRAHVIPVPGEKPGAEELIAHCRARIAGYKCPRVVELVEELPRNATGKVLKRELRAPFWEGHERLVN